MSRVLIGVDAGTSNLKAAAFDLDGEQIEIATIENPVETPQSGWQEQNMTTNWKKTATVISEVVEDIEDDHEILGIGITGQGDGCCSSTRRAIQFGMQSSGRTVAPPKSSTTGSTTGRPT